MYAFFTVLGTLLAPGGALPQGRIDKTDAAQAMMAANKGADSGRRSCLSDLMNVPGGNGLFSKDGGSFYLLANRGLVKNQAGPNGESKSKYTVYVIDPVNLKAQALVSLEQKGDASLVLYGDPVEALSVVSFVGKTANCYEGAAGVTSVHLAKKSAKAVQSSGALVIARSPDGATLINTKTLQIVEMDLPTFQTKTVMRVKEAERPLWYSPVQKRTVSFRDDGKNRGLVDLTYGEEKARRLAVKPKDKVLQNGPWFAAARLDLKKNQIEIEEWPKWSGQEQAGKYRITLPASYPVAMAGLEVSFKQRVALAMGASFVAKRQWQRLFVYDYTRAEPIATLSVDGTRYLNFAMIDPSGSYAVIEVRDGQTRATSGLKIFRFATKSFEDLILPAPPPSKEGANAEKD